MRNTILYTVAFLFMGFVLTAQNDKEAKQTKKSVTQNKKDSNKKSVDNVPNTDPVKIKNNIYMVQDKGGNIGLSFGNDGVFIIDDQFEEIVPKLIENIKKISDKPIKYLVNTHHHHDHTGGNILLAKQGAAIISHKNVRERLLDLSKNSPTKIDIDILPIITFSEDLSFYFNNEEIMIFYVHDAHTDGDVIVYFTGSNVIHMGDTFFNGRYPFIDLKSGGSVKGSIEALDKVLMLANENTKIIPGHGNLATIAEVKLTKIMLTFFRNRIKLLYLDQKSEDEVVAMKELTEKYDAQRYGDGFISTEIMVRTIYKDVEKEMSAIDTRSMEERLEEQQKELMKKGKG